MLWMLFGFEKRLQGPHYVLPGLAETLPVLHRPPLEHLKHQLMENLTVSLGFLHQSFLILVLEYHCLVHFKASPAPNTSDTTNELLQQALPELTWVH